LKIADSDTIEAPLIIISGGQTGADRAALDWAILHGIPYGGWCPRARRAEDGRISERYRLKETPLQKYQQGTAWNIRDSDATLILASTDDLTGDSLVTYATATRYQQPCLVISSRANWKLAVREFMACQFIAVLHVAGPRKSTVAGMTPFVHSVLDMVFMLVRKHSTLTRGTCLPVCDH